MGRTIIHWGEELFSLGSYFQLFIILAIVINNIHHYHLIYHFPFFQQFRGFNGGGLFVCSLFVRLENFLRLPCCEMVYPSWYIKDVLVSIVKTSVRWFPAPWNFHTLPLVSRSTSVASRAQGTN